MGGADAEAFAGTSGAEAYLGSVVATESVRCWNGGMMRRKRHGFRTR